VREVLLDCIIFRLTPLLTEQRAADARCILETATGLTIPHSATDTAYVLPVPVVGWEGCTFQEWIDMQLVRLGSFSFCSMEDTAGPAFLGTLEQSIHPSIHPSIWIFGCVSRRPAGLPLKPAMPRIFL
jgi:hypothetical protein